MGVAGLYAGLRRCTIVLFYRPSTGGTVGKSDGHFRDDLQVTRIGYVTRAFRYKKNFPVAPDDADPY